MPSLSKRMVRSDPWAEATLRKVDLATIKGADKVPVRARVRPDDAFANACTRVKQLERAVDALDEKDPVAASLRAELQQFWLKPFLVQNLSLLVRGKSFAICFLYLRKTAHDAPPGMVRRTSGVGANCAWLWSQERAVAIGSVRTAVAQVPNSVNLGVGGGAKRGSTPRPPANVVRERKTLEQVRSDVSTKVSRL